MMNKMNSKCSFSRKNIRENLCNSFTGTSSLFKQCRDFFCNENSKYIKLERRMKKAFFLRPPVFLDGSDFFISV